jgi:carbamoyltransferase
MGPNIIGISAFYHDSACCVLKNGVLVAAAEEERFSRIKGDASIPGLALRFCLKEAGLRLSDIDCIAYYEDPQKKLARQLWSGRSLGNRPSIRSINKSRVPTAIREVLGFEKDIFYYDHHMSHAASSFYYSGFDDAAILTVDGVGEWATTTYALGSGQQIGIFEEVHFPDSLGLLYSTITSYLGFGVNDGEYKVMGLAPYGEPIFVDKIRQLIISGPGGQYQLDMQYFDFLAGKQMYTDRLSMLLGKPPRPEKEDMTQFHMDIAKSLQVVLEEILIEKARYLHQRTGMRNLCMAGGVALNCVANGKVLKKGPFKQLFVQPAANDAGACLGAAALAHLQLTGDRPLHRRLEHVYLGPAYSATDVRRLLRSTALHYAHYETDSVELYAETARRLSEGKVIGWFQGRMEFGPRSLGARSILADPRDAGMRDRINAMVKKREGFRPFAPAVLASKASQHFDIDHPSPFMLETCNVISALDLPAITHIDGSARVQTVTADTNPAFNRLLGEFEALTGCPILLNTSFNVKGEPIVCSPEDALKCFITTDIDTLVIEGCVIDRSASDMDLLRIFLQKFNPENVPAHHDLYTFV